MNTFCSINFSPIPRSHVMSLAASERRFTTLEDSMILTWTPGSESGLDCQMCHLVTPLVREVQGYLAHKKQPPPLGPPQGPRHSPTVGSQGGAVSSGLSHRVFLCARCRQKGGVVVVDARAHQALPNPLPLAPRVLLRLSGHRRSETRRPQTPPGHFQREEGATKKV